MTSRNDAILAELQVSRNLIVDAMGVRAANLAADKADLETANAGLQEALQKTASELAEAKERIKTLEAAEAPAEPPEAA